MCTYDLLFYLNADETRLGGCGWRTGYSIVTLPLIRNMIDDFYNVTFILQNPGVNGSWFRKSGYRNALAALDDDETQYGGRPEWDEWLSRQGRDLDFSLRNDGLKTSEVLVQASWPTLGTYIRPKKKGEVLTPRQELLKALTYGEWREYSAMAHIAFEGLMRVAAYYMADSMAHEQRRTLDEIHPRILYVQIGRADGNCSASSFPTCSATPFGVVCCNVGKNAYLSFGAETDLSSRNSQRIRIPEPHVQSDRLRPLLSTLVVARHTFHLGEGAPPNVSGCDQTLKSISDKVCAVPLWMAPGSQAYSVQNARVFYVRTDSNFNPQ